MKREESFNDDIYESVFEGFSGDFLLFPMPEFNAPDGAHDRQHDGIRFGLSDMTVIHTLSDDVFYPFHVAAAFLHEFCQPGFIEVFAFVGGNEYFIESGDPDADVKSKDGFQFINGKGGRPLFLFLQLTAEIFGHPKTALLKEF